MVESPELLNIISVCPYPWQLCSQSTGAGGSKDDTVETQAMEGLPYLEPEYENEHAQPPVDEPKADDASDGDEELPENEALPVRGSKPKVKHVLDVLIHSWDVLMLSTHGETYKIIKIQHKWSLIKSNQIVITTWYQILYSTEKIKRAH